jgi:hypothetical protein
VELAADEVDPRRDRVEARAELDREAVALRRA